jgi:DNA polymerase-3 subunit beta
MLRSAITQVAIAAAVDEARPMLTGVLVQFEGDQMTMAAADGYRLSVRTDTLADSLPEPLSVIVPARAMTELARVSAEQEDPVFATVTPDHNRVLFQLTDVVLVSQLIAGNFPDYQQIIPGEHTTRTTVNSPDLLKACRTAQIFARDGSNIVQFHVYAGSDLEPGRLVVSATSAETGDDVSELDATVEGESIEVAFNVRYIIDVLSVVDSPQVALDTTSASSPGVIRMVGDDGFIHVVMPMHLGR